MEKTTQNRPVPGTFTFAGCVLDPGTRCLTRGGEPVPLTPKEFHALLLLAQAGGHAVARETLIQAIWPETVVGDTSLGRIISVLRRQLGAETILSVARFGYRLVPEVVLVEPVPVAATPPVPTAAAPYSLPAPPAPPARPAHRWRLYAAAAVVVLTITGIAALSPTLARRQGRRSLLDADAARWDSLGLFALREGTYFKASKAFQEAVQLAPDNALLHAHLAEAWLQLNMDDPARQELVQASSRDAVQQLTEREQLYIEAVRSTAVHDYPAATRQYKAIADAAPQDDQPNALGDLGRALQRESRLPEATATYRQVADLQPGNAGVQLQLGILAALQRDQAAATTYFDRALNLYDASSNLEGKAEVAYQRASMAYVTADYVHAATFYQNSFDLSLKLNDLQMQARALGGLSTIRRWQGDLAASADAADREMALANTLNSDYWRAEGVMHLANVAIARKDVAESRRLLTQALELANRTHQPRLQANAEFSIADLADQTADFSQELAFAQLAREHYASYGSTDGVADASLQIAHAEGGLHNYRAALRDARALLETSVRTGSDLFAEDSEAELGHIYSATGNYTAALDHYQRALDLARKTGSQISLKTLHVVCVLMQLGRQQPAKELFAMVPSSARSEPDTEKKYKEAYLILQQSTRGGRNEPVNRFIAAR